ncbi:MAG: divalent-cation tolerance protein CutA [Alphaproteobacteria bacterium]|nr:divalent-cation tolerance protein CutA [Alphaproteobacteria bacterium]
MIVPKNLPDSLPDNVRDNPQDNDNVVLVYTTFPDSTSAKQVGGELVGQGLAACVNILPGMVSLYRWQGVLETSDEVVMIIKTRAGRVDDLVREVERRHPYDTPAVLTFAASGGSPAYIDWIRQMTTPQQH